MQIVIQDSAVEALSKLHDIDAETLIFAAVKHAATGKDPNWDKDPAFQYRNNPEIKAIYALMRDYVYGVDGNFFTETTGCVDLAEDDDFDVPEGAVAFNLPLNFTLLETPGEKVVSVQITDVDTGNYEAASSSFFVYGHDDTEEDTHSEDADTTDADSATE